MQKFALVTVALALSGPALAADMAIKAPPPAIVTQVFSWTGFYVGADIGADWATSDVTATADPLGLGGPNNALLRQEGSRTLTASSVIGGLQAGYNWQTNNIVFGIEGDVAPLRASRTATPSFACPGYGGGTCTYQEEFDRTFFATLRPRLGLALDRSLIYATGGLAVARWSSTDTLFISAAPPPASTSGSKTVAGWTVGGGIEYAWTNNWSVGIDYLYAYLGNMITVTPTLGPFNGGAFNDIHFQQHLTENLVRVNLSYKFGAPKN